MPNYLDFADSDYVFFVDAYEHCSTFGPMVSLACSICERYLKHLIDTYVYTENILQDVEKEKILKSVSLAELIRFVNNEMKIAIPNGTEMAMRAIDPFRRITQYPGSVSFFADKDDLEKAAKAVQLTRQFVYETIKLLKVCQ